MNVEERFWSKVNKTETCWIWTAAHHDKGYGRFRDHDGVIVPSHRFSLMLAGQELIDGYVVDHLCRNPACVNPAHLEQVEHLENVRRGLAGERQKAITHCPNGHAYATPDYDGKRRCRVCRNAAAKTRYNKRSK